MLHNHKFFWAFWKIFDLCLFLHIPHHQTPHTPPNLTGPLAGPFCIMFLFLVKISKAICGGRVSMFLFRAFLFWVIDCSQKIEEVVMEIQICNSEF